MKIEKKKKNINHSFKIGTPEGKRIWASTLTPKHKNYTTIFLVHGTSLKNIRKPNTREKGGMRVGER
jgi:preprotein translocase subunit Sss1